MKRLLPILLLLSLALPTKTAYGGWGTEGCLPVGGLSVSSYRSKNFIVSSPAEYFSKQIAEVAEKTYVAQSIEWLGYEQPPLNQPCPIKVTITQDTPNSKSSGGGATTFSFDRGRLLGMSMHVEGPTDKLLDSVVPHEVTHIVFAQYFQEPVPRWFDEGGSVCSESVTELSSQNNYCRNALNTGTAIPLSRLMNLKEYPPNQVMAFYAEGYSLTRFLMEKKSKPKLMGFILQAKSRGWDEALQVTYDIPNVNELEKQWLTSLRETKGQPVTAISGSGVNQPAVKAVTPQPTITQPMTTISADTDTKTLLMQVVENTKGLPQLKAKVDNLDSRMTRLEQEMSQLKNRGGSVSPSGGMTPIPGWNQPRANTYPAPPSSSPFIQPYNPNCPNGLCPVPNNGFK